MLIKECGTKGGNTHSADVANAQKITPNHIYQVADNVVAELQLLLDANFSDAKLPSVAVVKGKRPRDVIQKTQEILRQLETLTMINGRTMGSVAPVPVREIRPADVKRPIDRILKEVRALKPIFRVTVKLKPAPLYNDKKPANVYVRLTQASLLINRLDIPKPVPNDVRRSALAIVGDLEIVGNALRVPKPALSKIKFSGKKPSHAYTHARKVLAGLKTLTQSDAKLAIPGGVVLPPLKTGGITPGDVLDMQNTILAEISSIKAKASKTTPAIRPPSGKTPSDVFGVTDNALIYVQAIIKARAGG